MAGPFARRDVQHFDAVRQRQRSEAA
jgi:hypothetical protein